MGIPTHTHGAGRVPEVEDYDGDDDGCPWGGSICKVVCCDMEPCTPAVVGRYVG